MFVKTDLICKTKTSIREFKDIYSYNQQNNGSKYECVGSYKLINTPSNLFLEPTSNEQLVSTHRNNGHEARDPKISSPWGW